MDYRFSEIEPKWIRQWEADGLYRVEETTAQPKYYVLDMFPYPSGAGLHMGHPLGYTASDIFSRYKRMCGFNVLHPMGYDAFGLPAEQYALETGTHPAVTTERSIKVFRSQLDKIGFSFDWSRQVSTADPQYYKWTQWIFIRLFESWYNRETKRAENISTLVHFFETQGCIHWHQHDKNDHEEFSAAQWKAFSADEQQKILLCYRLAFLKYAEVNWCPALGTVLANDEVKDGMSERGGHPVERKKMRQWFLRITEYADRLLEGLDRVQWSTAMKDMQRNWIGKSEGALIEFKTDKGFSLPVFTTRPDTIFGVTFMVIAPEHELVDNLTTSSHKLEIDKYLEYVKSRTDVERQQQKKVTGAFTGSYAIHPFTGSKIPIWVAEYVLIGYGTGAIMAVPADDERDRSFAEKFNLPVVEIIDKSMHSGAGMEDKVGRMINSHFLNGLEVKEAIAEMLKHVEEKQIGQRQVNYKLRDAGFSRQRYWGEPFPIVYKNDLPRALRNEELPLQLPQVNNYKPTADGKAPLANNKEWMKGPDGSIRETDTMPGYAGSSWYFLRYMDPHNGHEFASRKNIDYWQDVDLYMGGAEHAVGHLMYARFWQKFLFDLGMVSCDEPFRKLVNQGMLLNRSSFVFELPGANMFISKGRVAEFESKGFQLRKIHADIRMVKDDKLDINAFKNWRDIYHNATFECEADGSFLCDSEIEKMSKSKHNVVNPDEIVRDYGADCLRMFLMFLGPIEQSKPWDPKSIDGVSKFLKKVWRLFFDESGQPKWKTDAASDASLKTLHRTIKKVTDDIERLNFNTCVSSLMICVNELGAQQCSNLAVLESLLKLLAPFAPFLSEELWQLSGHQGSIHRQSFPIADQQYLIESAFKYPVSINGRTRAELELPLNISAEEAQAQVLQLESVAKWLNGNQPKKVVFVKGKIINVVI